MHIRKKNSKRRFVLAAWILLEDQLMTISEKLFVILISGFREEFKTLLFLS